MPDTDPLRIQVTADISGLEAAMRRGADSVEEWTTTMAEAGQTAGHAFANQERLIAELQKRIAMLQELSRKRWEEEHQGAEEGTKQLEEYLKVQRTLLEGRSKAAATGFAAQAAVIEGRGARGEISQVDELTQLRDLHQAELAEEMRYITEKMAIDAADEKSAEKLAQDRAKQDELIAQAALKLAKDEQAILTAQQRQYERSFQQITRSFNTALNGWLQGTQTFGKAMTKMWDSIAIAAVDNLAKIAEQWLISMALQKTIAAQQVLADANQAAANSYAWASSWGGPIAGAIAAALAFAGVMAFDTFEYGGVVPRTGVAMVHAGERVLTPGFNTVFERAMAGGGGGLSAPMHIAIHGATDPAAVGRMVALQTSARIRRTARDLGYKI